MFLAQKLQQIEFNKVKQRAERIMDMKWGRIEQKHNFYGLNIIRIPRIQIQIVIIQSNIDMQKRTLKVIELEDKYIDHSSDYPYVQSCHKDKNVLFSLRTTKTYKYQPILIIDSYEKDKMVLPLIVGRSIDKCEDCEVLTGVFNQDGGWSCEYILKSPGLMHYQLVFVDYGGTVVKDLGCFDCILKVQNRVQLRKLRKQTVFPRCIGTIKDWQPFFKRQVQLGYNSFHFAPIQQTGFSKSYYSIYDQLELASDVFSGDNAQRYKQLQSFLLKFQKQNIIFFVDIVLNHTSFDSEWIKNDVSAVFTVKNTPLLASAYQLDIALRNWGEQIKANFGGDEDSRMNNDQFEQIKNQLTELVQNLKLYEFFEVKQTIIQQFLDSLPPRAPSQNIFSKDPSQVVMEFIQQNCIGLGEGRGVITIKNLGQRWKDLDCAYQQNDVKYGVKKFNSKWRKIIKNQWEREIINNIIGEIKYHYMDAKDRTYDDQLPFINPYFSHVHTKNGEIVPALNNGWVMGADTSQNLVTTKNFYYLRRKVSVWGDLIRIRYGDSPEDSPAWDHMRKYVQTMAKHFDGFRLDNLHGTQLNVAQWMIKQARKVKPEIIIFAELFCSTQREKAIFVRTSGVNSTLFELRHHLNGGQFLALFYESMGNQGKYTGSLSPHFDRPDGHRVKYCKRKKPIPLIYDLTHDNKTYEQTGDAIRKTPICIITEFSGAFVGSTKGFDQFYSKKIFVTQTNALYLQDEQKPVTNHKFTKLKKKIIYPSASPHDSVQVFGNWNFWGVGGTLQYKGKMGHQIDLQLGGGQYEYKFKVNGQWVNDERKIINKNGNHEFSTVGQQVRFVHHNLEMLRKRGAESRDKFFDYNEYYAYCENDVIVLLRQKKHTRESVCIIVNLSKSAQSFNNPVKLPGKIYKTDVWIQSDYSMYEGQMTDVEIVNHTNINEFFDVYFNAEQQKDILLVNKLPPGFGCIIQCKKTQIIVEALKSIRQLRDLPIHPPPLGPLDYNLIMYGVEPEEIARFNSTNYYIPSQKRKLIFGGFGGIIAEIQKAKRNNLLSIGLFDNIRQGNWLLDYYVSRLKRYKHLNQFTDLVERYFQCLKKIPAYLRPKYFSGFIYKIYKSLQQQISNGSKNRFERKLLLATTQFISSFEIQNPAFRVTMSAGLPHFTVGWSRCWGRDTFMSNQLLLLYPNIYRDTILQFGATLRHGMIPNLLDFGKNPRYNCRDACWWFIRGIKQYARHTQDYSIFKTKVNMLFLSSDPLQHRQKVKRGETKVMLVQEIVHSIFQSHADGISYRQWNAGYQIDTNMSSDGFTVHLNVDEDTGFVVGGNAYNCLTWMDKMGSSGRAGNKGYPATPRAGAPVQLTALLYHCLAQYDKLYKQGHYSFNQVKFAKLDISYEYWAKRIRQNFEFYYFIDEKSDKTKYQHIYKDVCLPPSGLYYEQFRLRPNALIALALTPQIINPDHALSFLKIVQRQLISDQSIGISTLGEAHDSLYVPYYDNSDDSIDIKVAHGFSYHNGPEWVWLYGFYVKAKCNFNKGLKKNQLNALLQNHARYLYSNDWGSLPQLTNKNGQLNNFSCQSQAWSVSSMLLAINSIKQYLTPSEKNIERPPEQIKQKSAK